MFEAIDQYPLLHHSSLHIVVFQHHILLEGLEGIELSCGHLLGENDLKMEGRGVSARVVSRVQFSTYERVGRGREEGC